MLWLKAFHIVFVVAWFAGLFYLPRLFVYHCEVRDEEGYQRFCTMERRLHTMTTIGLAGTWIFGVAMLTVNPGFLHGGWLHAKLALVFALSGYSGWLKTHVRAFAARTNTRSARYFRIVNEIPAVVLVAVVILVVVKPF
jgi:putative membrane protein